MKVIKCQVISDYKSAFSDPLIIVKDEILTISVKESEWKEWLWCINQFGKGGWVPEKYIERLNDKKCKALRDYDATELTVEIGEEIIISNEVSGWAWVTNKKGKSGWVPLENIQIIQN